MEHTDAILSNAVDRYLLGEMTEDEQRIFEEHYFDCRVCGADVTDGTRMMMSGGVEAARHKQMANVVPMPVNRFRWLSTAAAVPLIFGLFGSGVGYRLALQRDHPTELVRVVQITGIVRSETPQAVPTVQPGDILRFDVRPDDDAVRYTALVTCGGKTQSTNGISRERAADAITLQLGELPPGRCELVIEGVRKDGNRFEITSTPFKVGGERTGVR